MASVYQQLPLWQDGRRCTKCGIEKPVSEFYRHVRRADGIREQCKACVRGYNKGQYWADPERHKSKAKAWHHANCERAAAASRKWREQHPERKKELAQQWYWSDRDARLRSAKEYYRTHKQSALEYSRRYHAEHCDRIRAAGKEWREKNRCHRQRAAKAYYLANRERVIAATKNWIKSNRERRRWQNIVCKHRRRCRINDAPGTTSSAQIQGRMAFFGWRCWLCGGEADSVDHVIPVACGGSNWPANLRPACRDCNSRKGAKSWREFSPWRPAPPALP